MKPILTMTILVLLSGGPTACSTTDPRQNGEQDTTRHVVTLDDKLVEVAKRVSGFGGMFFDDAGTLNVYMVQEGKSRDAQEAGARTSQLTEALTAVFGQEFLGHRSLRQDSGPEYQEGTC